MKLTFTVREFCEAHSISRSQYFKLKKEGRGPAVMRVSRGDIISAEAAAEWRRKMTEPATPAAPAAPASQAE